MQQLQELQRALTQLFGAVQRVASSRDSRGSVLVDDPAVIARARSSGSAAGRSSPGGGSSASRAAAGGAAQQQQPLPESQQQPPQPPAEQRAFMARLRVGTVLQDAVAALQAAPGLLPGLLQCKGVPAVSEKVRELNTCTSTIDGACGCLAARLCVQSACHSMHWACCLRDIIESTT